MDAELKLEILTICTWQILALMVLLVAYVIMYMKASKTPNRRAFFMVQLAIGIWLVGKIFKTVSPDVDTRWLFIVVYYFGICMLEAVFLEFGFTYKYGRHFTLRERLLIYLLPVIQFLLVATNPYHHLFYATYDFYHDTFGSLFYAHVLIEYVYIFTGIVLCSSKVRQQFKHKHLLYRVLIGTAVIGPIILNLLYISRALQDFFDWIGLKIIFDVTPIVFTWSLLLFVYATFRYAFMDISPLMKHEIIDKLNTPVCLINEQGYILFCNDIMDKQMDCHQHRHEIIKFIQGQMKVLVSDNVDTRHFAIDGHYYMYHAKMINTIEGKRYLIVFNNITDIEATRIHLQETLAGLKIANEKLNHQIAMLRETSKISARNFVARELHDIIGHALVVTMKLLEMSRISYHQDRDISLESLIKAKKVTMSGVEQMRHISVHETGHFNSKLLKQELNTMISEIDVPKLNVRLFFKGEDLILDQTVYDTVVKVSKELITNTLKHAEADRMLLSYKISGETITINTMDNGKGCQHFKKGNGIKGIEERVKAINGSANFKTSAGEGFVSQIIL